MKTRGKQATPKNPNVAEGFREALRDSRSQGTVPPVFAIAEYKVKVDQLRCERDVDALLAALLDVPSESPHPATEVQQEYVEGFFTDLLRDLMMSENRKPPHQTTIDNILVKVKSLLKHINTGAGFSAELNAEAIDVIRVIESETTPTADVRVADARISASGAEGILKIFAALGRKILTRARENLAASSVDEMLSSKVNEALDITNILKPLGVVSSQLEQTATEANKGLHVHVEIARQGSRVFKEAHSKTLDNCVMLLLESRLAARVEPLAGAGGDLSVALGGSLLSTRCSATGPRTTWS